MSPITQVAEQFGKLIAGENYAAAHGLLTKDAQKVESPEDFKQIVREMTAYAPGPIREVQVMEDYILEDWPDKQQGDIAHVYVSLGGDSYVEGVALILVEEAGITRIRQLQWGRP